MCDRCKELELQCAALREALEAVRDSTASSSVSGWARIHHRARTALASTTAGADILARLQRAEEKAATFERDWMAAKHEFGEAQARVREHHRAEVEELREERDLERLRAYSLKGERNNARMGARIAEEQVRTLQAEVSRLRETEAEAAIARAVAALREAIAVFVAEEGPLYDGCCDIADDIRARGPAPDEPHASSDIERLNATPAEPTEAEILRGELAKALEMLRDAAPAHLPDCNCSRCHPEFYVGVDPAHGEDQAAVTVGRRLPDGSVEVVATATGPEAEALLAGPPPCPSTPCCVCRREGRREAAWGALADAEALACSGPPEDPCGGCLCCGPIVEALHERACVAGTQGMEAPHEPR